MHLSTGSVFSRAAVALPLLALAACGSDVAGPRPTDPQAVDIAYCLAPDWVAFQDGDGAWSRAVGTPAGPFVTFHHAFVSDHAGIAIVRDFGRGLTGLLIAYGTPEELSITSDTTGVACGNSEFKTFHGTVAGLDTGEVARLSAGFGATAFVSAGTGPAFDLSGLPPGSHDILATRIGRVNDGPFVNAVIRRHTSDLPDGATLSLIDFNSAEAFALVAHTFTVAGPNPAGTTTSVGLRTTAGVTDLLAVITTPSTATTAQYLAISDPHLDAGDLQSLTVTSAPTGSVVRSSQVFFHSADDRTVTLGAIPNPPALSVASSTPTLRMRARFDAQRDYDRMTTIGFQQDHQSQITTVTVQMTAAYASRNPTGYDLVIPELTGVEGFDSRWALHAGPSLFWTSLRFGGTLRPGFNAVPTNGATSRTATDGGTLTP